MSTHVEIKESPKLQTRIRVVTFKGRKLVDVRKFYKAQDGGEWAPTKKGIAIQPEHIDALVDALKKLKASAIQTTSQVASGEEVVKYVIATSREGAYLKKTGFYDTVGEAAKKPFPKTMSQTAKMQYKVFKVLVRDGAVVKSKTELIRKGDKWVRPLKPKAAPKQG